MIFFAFVINGVAQEAKQVIFENYTHAQADSLHLLKRDEGISSFKSMSALKHEAVMIKENAVVTVDLAKSRKSKIQLTDLIQDRKESVLMICRYIPANSEAEKAKFSPLVLCFQKMEFAQQITTCCGD